MTVPHPTRTIHAIHATHAIHAIHATHATRGSAPTRARTDLAITTRSKP